MNKEIMEISKEIKLGRFHELRGHMDPEVPIEWIVNGSRPRTSAWCHHPGVVREFRKHPEKKDEVLEGHQVSPEEQQVSKEWGAIPQNSQNHKDLQLIILYPAQVNIG